MTSNGRTLLWVAACLPFVSTAALAQAPARPDLDMIVRRAKPAGAPAALPHSDGPTACAPEWLATFGGRAGLSGDVSDAIVFDDGSGSAVYVGGALRAVAGRETATFARFDGASWTALSAPPRPIPRAFGIHDAGAGPALYCASSDEPFASAAMSVARWDGQQWLDLGGTLTGRVNAIASYDDSTGSALYIGGDFTLTPPVGAIIRDLARWNGVSWSGVGTATLPEVFDLEVFDDGVVAALYVVGNGTFTLGSTSSVGAASWSAAGWSAIGGTTITNLRHLHAFDNGTGPALYAAGRRANATSPVALRLQGSLWTPFDLGLSSDIVVDALSSLDGGAGPRLVASTSPSAFIGHSTGDVTVWTSTGGAWSPYSINALVPWGFQPPQVRLTELITLGSAAGERLYALGKIDGQPGSGLHGVVQIEGNDWSPVGGNAMIREPVSVSTAFGTGAARRFVTARRHLGSAGGSDLHIDAWDGLGWTSLGQVTATPQGQSLGTEVTMLTVLVEGNGERLYVGGDFAAIDGVPARGIARFDGQQWTPLGAGIAGPVYDVELFGGGAALFATGAFQQASGVAANGIARFDGLAWHPLGSGLSPASAGSLPRGGRALQVFESLAGPAELYVAGDFGTAGGITTPALARWNGSSWQGVGSGLQSFFFPGVADSLCVFDFGGGPTLVVGGEFDAPLLSTTEPNGLARWDGAQWVPFNVFANLGGQGTQRLAVFDDGSGEALYLGGVFPPSFAPGGLMRWNGQQFELVEASIAGNVASLTVFDDGSGRALYCGGGFAASPAGDSYLTRWGGCRADVGTVYCAPAVVNSTGSAATLEASGSENSFEGDVVLHAEGLPSGTFGAFLTSRSPGLVPGYNGSAGTLCLGGLVALYARPGEVRQSGPAGEMSLTLDLRSTPIPGGAIAIAPGDTWHFQLWYRDATPAGATSNFSGALRLAFD